jgi:hypothetical protein
LTVRFLEDLIGGLGPDERVGAVVVPAVDEAADLGVELLDGAERAAADGLAFDDAEPDLDQVERDCCIKRSGVQSADIQASEPT